MKKAFTLIELLIVIALLGALAVGLLAALDPFEQLKKGTDTGVRNTVAEIHGAVIRYYAIKNHMPWCSGDPLVCVDPAAPVTAKSLTNVGLTGPLDKVITSGELKADFVSIAGGQLDKIWVTGVNDPPTIVVCYMPTSKSFTNDPNTKFSKAGVSPSNSTSGPVCPSNVVSDDCWYCIQ